VGKGGGDIISDRYASLSLNLDVHFEVKVSVGFQRLIDRHRGFMNFLDEMSQMTDRFF
jgi:hypothetical protein